MLAHFPFTENIMKPIEADLLFDQADDKDTFVNLALSSI